MSSCTSHRTEDDLGIPVAHTHDCMMVYGRAHALFCCRRGAAVINIDYGDGALLHVASINCCTARGSARKLAHACSLCTALSLFLRDTAWLNLSCINAFP